MSGPEYLEDTRPRLTGGRLRAVVAVVVVVLAALVAVRVQGLEPGPSPAPTEAPSGPSPSPTPSREWPAAGLVSGTLFVAAGGRVHYIDAVSGLLSETEIEVEAAGASMTPIGAGVLVTSAGGRRKQLLARGSCCYPVLGALRAANAFLPGPEGSAWAATIDPGGTDARTTWRRVDQNGEVLTTVTVVGYAAGDGAGGLLEFGRRGFRRLYPEPRGAVQAGDLIAAGPDGYLLRRCGPNQCTAVLHDRAADTDRDLEVRLPGAVTAGTLSPGNRYAAATEIEEDENTVRVGDLRARRVLRSFPGSGTGANAAVWLSERWVAFVSEDRLVLYDAVADRVAEPELPLSGISSLVWQPT